MAGSPGSREARPEDKPHDPVTVLPVKSEVSGPTNLAWHRARRRQGRLRRRYAVAAILDGGCARRPLISAVGTAKRLWIEQRNRPQGSADTECWIPPRVSPHQRLGKDD